MLAYKGPDRKKIFIDVENATCTLNFDYPYEIDLARIKTAADLLGWVRQLAGKPWMTAERLKLFVDAISKHKGFKVRS